MRAGLFSIVRERLLLFKSEKLAGCCWLRKGMFGFMPDYKKYEKFLHDRGVSLSEKDFASLMSLMEFAADSAGHFEAADHRATGLLVEELNKALEAAGAQLRLVVDDGGKKTGSSEKSSGVE